MVMVPQVFQIGNSDRVGCDLGEGVLSSPQSGSRAGTNAIEATRICHQ